MDALPVTEATNLPFASKVRATYLGQEVGVMHACGHDVHTAVQIGVASVLSAIKADLPGHREVHLPAGGGGGAPGEEGGAALMVKEGASRTRGPQAIFGLHTMSRDGGRRDRLLGGPGACPRADTWEVKITGRQSHGARPELSIDPDRRLPRTFVTALQTIRSRTLLRPRAGRRDRRHDPWRAAQQHHPVGSGADGHHPHVPPDMSQLAEKRLREILQGVTAAAGATRRGGAGTTVSRQRPSTTRRSRTTPCPRSSVSSGRTTSRASRRRWLSEDFWYFANTVPGFFFRLGQVAPGQTSGDHHTPTFVADDAAIRRRHQGR